MTEDQRKQYEEAASNYSPYGSLDSIGTSTRELFETRKRHFIAGCEHAHSKIEEAEREGYNKALDDVIEFVNSNNATYSNYTVYTEELIEELKRLRK